MTITSLKIIAMILMLIDHMGAFMTDAPIWFRWLGRLSAPIFIFAVTEGMKHTRNRKYYLTKLYLFSLITSFVFYLTQIIVFVQTGQMRDITLNITGTLFQGALLIYIIDLVKSKKRKSNWELWVYLIYQGLMIMLATLILNSPTDFGNTTLIAGSLSSIKYCSGGVIWIILFLVFYYSNSNKRKVVNYIVYCFGTVLIRNFSIFARIGIRLRYYRWEYLSFLYEFVMESIMGMNVKMVLPVNNSFQWFMVFAVVPIYFYNGKYGKGLKKLFYVFYIAHIVVLYLIFSF